MSGQKFIVGSLTLTKKYNQMIDKPVKWLFKKLKSLDFCLMENV